MEQPRRSPAPYVLVALAVLVYANTLRCGYAVDDHLIITHNRFTTQGIRGLAAIFSHDLMTGYYGTGTIPVMGGRYRPLTLATHALEYQLFGELPAISHAVNVLLYAATVLLLYLLLRRLLPEPGGGPWYRSVPFLAAALFAVHPVHTEVVANIKERDDLLALLFALAALVYWLGTLDRPTRRSHAGVAGLFLLSLLSKESTISVLALAPAILWYRAARPLRAALAAAMPFVATAIVYVAIRLAVVGVGFPTVAPELMNEPFLDTTATQHVATLILTWGWYLLLLVVPHPLTHDYYPYHVPIVDFSNPLVLLAIVVHLALGYVLVTGLPKRTIPSFCVFWYLATFALYANVLFGIGTFMNERFLYLPSIGFTLLVAWVAVERIRRPAVLAALALIVLVAGSAKTFARTFAWKDDVTLALTDVETSKGSARAQMAAGWAHLTLAEREPDAPTHARELAAAVAHLRTSVAICRTYFPALSFLGSALGQSGAYAEALEYYTATLAMKPANADLLNDVQAIAERAAAQRDFRSALAAYDLLIAQQPLPAFYDAVGRIYGQELGDLTRAQASLEIGLRLTPENVALLQDLGIVYAMSGRIDDAIALFDRAIAVAPQDAAPYVNKALALRRIGKAAEAEAATRKARELDPTVAAP